MIFKDAQAAGGAGILGEYFAVGSAPGGSAGAPPTALGVSVPPPPPTRPSFKQTGAAPTEPGIRTEEGNTPRSVSIGASYPLSPRSIANEP